MSIERSLNVHIKTTADTAGVEEAKNQFGQLGDHMTEAWKSGGKLEGVMHKQREIFTELSENTLPGFGRILNAAFEGPLGLGIALLGLYGAIKESITAANEELDKQADALAEHWSHLGEAIEEFNLKTQNAADATTNKLKELAAGMDAINERTEKSIDAAHREAAAQKAITAAVEEYLIAKLKADGGDKDQIASMEALIKSGGGSRSNKIESGTEQAEINAKLNQLDNALLNQRNLQDIVKKLGPGEAERQGRIKNAPDVEEHFKKMADDNHQAITKQQAEVDKLNKVVSGLKSSNDDIGSGPYIEVWQGKLDKAREKLAELNHELEANTHAIEQEKQLTAKRDLEQKNYEDAKKALEEITKKVHELTAAASALQSAHSTSDNTRDIVEQLHSGVVNSRGATDAIVSVLQSILDNARAQLGATALAHGNTQKLQAETETLIDQISELKRQIASAHARISTTNANTPGR